MNAQQHIINKQVMKVEVAAQEHTMTVHEQLAHICQTTLPPILEKICDQVGDEKYEIHLDRLSIDLGQLEVTTLNSDLKEKVAEKFEEALLKVITSSIPTSSINSTGNAAISPLELLKHFLSTGLLPDWVNSSRLDLNELFDTLLKEQYEHLRDFVTNTHDQKSICNRLAHWLNDKQFKAFIVKWTNTPSMQDWLDDLFKLEKYIARSIDSKSIQTKETILMHVFQSHTHFSINELFQRIVQIEGPMVWNNAVIAFSAKKHSFKSDLPRFLPLLKTASKSWLRNTVSNLLQQYPEAFVGLIGRYNSSRNQPINFVSSVLKNQHELKEAEINFLADEIHQWILTDNSFEKEFIELVAKSTTMNAEEHVIHPSTTNSANRCSIHNAGMILLWPYITHVFAECGLTKEDAFISEAAAHRGTLLLQYAVNSQEVNQEYDLPLNKLLCGLDVTAPIATYFLPPINKREKKAIQSLWDDVIENWTALRGSSSESLQESFLQRKGSLTRKGNDWLLAVEQQTQDILLGQLPWGLGTVKLPWMKQLIHTKW